MTMEEPNLLSVCVIAFVAVMLLLGFEAVVIRLIAQLFPERKPDDELIAAAIQQAIESRYPGARVVSVEELGPDPGSSRAAH